MCRASPSSSRRFTGTFADADDTIVGISQLCKEDVNRKDDLRIT
jgi:hypothetical protein